MMTIEEIKEANNIFCGFGKSFRVNEIHELELQVCDTAIELYADNAKLIEENKRKILEIDWQERKIAGLQVDVERLRRYEMAWDDVLKSVPIYYGGEALVRNIGARYGITPKED